MSRFPRAEPEIAALALEDAAEDRRCGPVERTPALLGTNCPRTLAAHTLSALPTKAMNARPTTGGFHMHGVHACELP